MRLAEVEEGGRRRLKTAGHDFREVRLGPGLVAIRERERHRGGALREVLQISHAVEGLQRVGLVEFERAEERIEFKAAVVHVVVEIIEEVVVVAVEHGLVVVAVRDEVIESVVGGFEADGVRPYVLFDVFAFGLAVLVELDSALVVVEVQHRVERVPVVGAVVGRAVGGRGVRRWIICHGYRCSRCECSSKNVRRPSRTVETSSRVPISSNR